MECTIEGNHGNGLEDIHRGHNRPGYNHQELTLASWVGSTIPKQVGQGVHACTSGLKLTHWFQGLAC